MSTQPNLDDANQTVFYIPFSGEDHDDDDSSPDVPLPQPLHTDRDLPEGQQLRLQAYAEAWRKCLDRIKSIIQALHAPIAADVVHQVHASYDDVLPGLPYPELPVITITNPSSSSTFLNEVAAQIDSPDLDSDALFDAPAFTTHLYPTDSLNISSTMKTMIAGFVDRSHILEKVKGRPATSLAPYDIEMLVAWYTAVREAYELKEAAQPKLVVLLHDFEQLDMLVIQDLFYICSLHIQRLPLVFIISLSSPSYPSYLHVTYPRSTLALLRVRNFAVPSGKRVLEEVLLKTFFDVGFDPDIVIGPAVLSSLADHFTRQDSSVDSILNFLHITHLKHFSSEPLTLLANSTPPSSLLFQPSAFKFLDSLITRMQTPPQDPASLPAAEWAPQSLPALVTAIDTARSDFRSRARCLRIGFRIIKLIQEFMKRQGYKGLDWNRHPGGLGIFDVMTDILRGTLGSDIKFLGTMVRKLRAGQLGSLLEELHGYFNSMPSELRASEQEARMKLVFTLNALPEDMEEDTTGVGSQLAGNFGEWLVGYLNGLIAPLEKTQLWEVWFTGLSPFPTELINPSVRSSIVSGLLRPHEFSELTEEDEQENQTDFSLWEYPDTSILFRRYLDSGKMINVYDWFESFQSVLEMQRKNIKKRLAAEARSRPQSPTKRAGKGKGKAKGKAVQKMDREEEDGEEDEDRLKLEVQARFMRALQELDYIGFIKHTRRKADHVQRTAFDLHD
ncbi:Origin recognition complex subunit 3 [Hypsizygus marmoreus]|uniref:Origin recognition complex subunit 3 n=1 Tax=Hypsizygus marmoreus TaxID=39966 RepID=A0A369JC84_HYPMA|nr:Origin recognition complex subunit 3 [Hypsizygus marmoreus]